jgi:two-component system, LuxR family, response regulator DctR
MHPAEIHIVDDDPDVRDGLAWLFDSRGYRATSWDGGQVFLDAALQMKSAWGDAVVILDIRMDPVSGPLVFERLQALACPWPVLFLTGHGDVGMAVAAVKKGAWDFLEKPFQDNDLVDRVAQALMHAKSTRESDHEASQLKQALSSLSPREREVLDQLVRGHYNKNIADALGITPRTVEFHRANIFEKMGVSSAVELAHKLGRLQG